MLITYGLPGSTFTTGGLLLIINTLLTLKVGKIY